MPKIALKSGSRSGSRSQVKNQRSRSNLWRTVVDIRSSALSSAAKSKEKSLSVHGVCLSGVCL